MNKTHSAGTTCGSARCQAHPYMIGHQMSRSGLRSRAITRTYVAIAVVGATFCATLMVLPSEGAVAKIGPGYGRMQPIDEGKPERVAYSVPYSIPARSQAPQAKPVRIIAEPVVAQLAPPLVIAAAQPSYIRDIHRVY
jgi:hypothetical protein